MILAVVFALAAAMANAVNLLTQHKASIGAPGRVRGWRLALYLPRQPLWLLGVAAAVGSFIFQALALHNGPMSVVQPLLVIVDPFASIILSVWLFGEHFTNSPAKIAAAVLSFAVMAAGVVMLTRTAPQDLSPSEPARSSRSQPPGSGDT